MSEVKQPQDRKPKAAKFKFVGADGKTYTLPFASEGADKLTGRDTRDALMGGDTGGLRLGFVLLEASGAEQAAIDALYDLPNDECITKLGEWMEHADGDGVTLPKS